MQAAVLPEGTQSDLLAAVIVVMALAFVLLLVGFFRATHRANKPSDHCDFPGCIAARSKMRALAAQYPEGIPPRLILAVVDGIEAHEHHGKAA